MSILFSNVTAVLMDDAHTVLTGAYVQVEGSKIVYVGQDRPQEQQWVARAYFNLINVTSTKSSTVS